MWNWLKKKLDEDLIIVEERAFNPTEELINSYKDRLRKDDALIMKLEEENEGLKMTIISLQGIINSKPVEKLPVIKHFNTIAGLKTELESRDRKKKEELKNAKPGNSNS
jgi:glutathionylspermidine synthase